MTTCRLRVRHARRKSFAAIFLITGGAIIYSPGSAISACFTAASGARKSCHESEHSSKKCGEALGIAQHHEHGECGDGARYQRSWLCCIRPSGRMQQNVLDNLSKIPAAEVAPIASETVSAR
jgi:hypothetical protein